MTKFTKLLFTVFCIFLFGCESEKSIESIFKEDTPKFQAEIKQTDQAKGSFSPENKLSGGKYKIAVIQSDDYPEYYEVFTAILQGMQLIGWIKENNVVVKDNYTSNRELINGINRKDYSDYIEFSPEMFFSFRADENNASDPQFKNVMRRAIDGEFDLVILLGTLASHKVLENKEYRAATLMDAVSDPIGSGFVESIDNSGKDFLTARIDPNQYIRQVRLFYKVIGFKSLGIIYENSENGRWYAAVDDVEKVAEENGIELVVDHDVMTEPTQQQYHQAYGMYLRAMDRVSPKVEAMFLGISGGLEPENLPNVVNKLIDYKLPSFTMEGAQAVKKGVMIGVSGKEAGLYNAKKLARILKGETPSTLDQRYEKMPKISINLKTTEKIGYDLPVDIIRSADEIYQ